MLRWSMIFLAIAITAGFLGFYSLEDAAAITARVLFFLFLLPFLVFLILGLSAGSTIGGPKL